MKKIGIIGGMSPQSTSLYYDKINDGINKALGKNHSAKMIINSVNFEEIVELQKNSSWQKASVALANEAKILEKAGVDAILLATNTMHKVADGIENVISIPFLHLIDATAKVIKRDDFKKIGLLGTSFTMSDGFYHQRMKNYEIEVITPSKIEQDKIHNIIFNELCLKKTLPKSKKIFLDAIMALKSQGAQGIILGCTEICLLIGQEDISMPLYDSTSIHIDCAISFILSE